MKRRKVRELIDEVLAARDAIPERPVTFDTFTVDFEQGVVKFRGRTIHPGDARVLSFPVLSTDRLIVTKSGEVW